MSPERYQRLKEVLQGAWEQDPGARSVYLDEACATDLELRALIDALLASEQENDRDWVLAPVEDNEPDVSSGRRMGPYRILREIGQGGMATVYLAERADGQYRKRVAIKIVRPHLSAEEVLRRFRNER